MFSTIPFNSIYQLMDAFPTEESCILHLEKLRWEGNVVSPFDEGSKVYVRPGHRYMCKNTNKYFNVRQGTIFEGTKLPLRQWFLAIYLFTTHKKGISSHQLARDLNITQKTAWFVLSRLRYAFNHESFLNHMEGSIEIDETFVGGKNKNRHHNKKVKNSQGRSFKDKTPVLGMMDTETKQVRCFVMADTSKDSIQPIVKNNIKEGSIIVTDEWRGYDGLEKVYNRQVVDHGRGQYVNPSGFTTNTMEGAWSHLKRTIIGTHHQVSRKHLQKYVNEFSFRYNTKKDTTDSRFHLFLDSVKGRRITYKKLIGE